MDEDDNSKFRIERVNGQCMTKPSILRLMPPLISMQVCRPKWIMSVTWNQPHIQALQIPGYGCVESWTQGHYFKQGISTESLLKFLVLSKWRLIYVAFCTNMTISRQKEARSRDYIPYSYRRVLHNAQYHGQHCTIQLFEKFRAAVYAQPRWQISDPTGIRIPVPLSFEPSPDRMSHRGWPIFKCRYGEHILHKSIKIPQVYYLLTIPALWQCAITTHTWNNGVIGSLLKEHTIHPDCHKKYLKNICLGDREPRTHGSNTRPKGEDISSRHETLNQCWFTTGPTP